MTEKPCPDFFRILSNRVWRTYLGGKILDSIQGENAPMDTHFPEDWILSATSAVNPGRETVREGVSIVETPEGPLLLTEILRRWPEEILGAEHLATIGPEPGFLLKYLDSSIRLHMQCHPTVSFAQKYLHSNSGKSEGYTILSIRPEAEGYIYLGFQKPLSVSKFREAVLKQDIAAILSCFEKIPVRPGDVFHVPGGCPHAIGEGVFMIEMMEPTDFAVRLEFERGGYILPESARFMNRGIDFAMEMLDFTPRSAQEIREELFVRPAPLPIEGGAEHYSLLDRRSTSCFRSERILVRNRTTLEQNGLRVFLVVQGNGILEIEGTRVPVRRYDRILIPDFVRKIGIVNTGKEPLELIVARPPEKRESLKNQHAKDSKHVKND